MPTEKSNKVEKLYYAISEVADMFKVNASLIRFWEKEFDIIKPKKNKKGNRLFTQKDVDNFHVIYHLVKEKGYTLSGAKERLAKNQEGVESNIEVIKTLKSIRSFLLDVKHKL
jgi:DNA-binding transcriptional MerR regulator